VIKPFGALFGHKKGELPVTENEHSKERHTLYTSSDEQVKRAIYVYNTAVKYWSAVDHFLKSQLDCRQFKNISLSVQHKIYSLNLPIYLLINKTKERIAI
jgi:hypothetical protein